MGRHNTPCGMNKAERDFFLCIHPHVRQLSRAIYRLWKIRRYISCQCRCFRDMSCISSWSTQFPSSEREGTHGQIVQMDVSDQMELNCWFLHHFVMILHKNSQYPFCKCGIGRRGEGICPCSQGKAETKLQHCSEFTLLECNNRIII